MFLQAKVAELEASLSKVLAERAATLERQRSAGKPPRPPTSGASSPRGAGAPGSPSFGRSGSGGDAALHIASLEIQVCSPVVLLVHSVCTLGTHLLSRGDLHGCLCAAAIQPYPIWRGEVSREGLSEKPQAYSL